jgi:hypothetical protein
MTAWTTPRTWTSTTLSASDLNTDVRDNLKNVDERLTLHGITSPSALNKFKQAKVGVHLAGSGSQSISDSTDTTLTWDAETYDTDAFHSTSSVTNRITIPSGLDGTYLITLSVRFEANSTGDRRIWVEDDAGTVLARIMGRATAASFTHQTLAFAWDLSAGDWISARVYQSSTGSLAVDKSIASTFFQAHRLFAA